MIAQVLDVETWQTLLPVRNFLERHDIHPPHVVLVEQGFGAVIEKLRARIRLFLHRQIGICRQVNPLKTIRRIEVRAPAEQRWAARLVGRVQIGLT